MQIPRDESRAKLAFYNVKKSMDCFQIRLHEDCALFILPLEMVIVT